MDQEDWEGVVAISIIALVVIYLVRLRSRAVVYGTLNITKQQVEYLKQHYGQAGVKREFIRRFEEQYRRIGFSYEQNAPLLKHSGIITSEEHNLILELFAKGLSTIAQCRYLFETIEDTEKSFTAETYQIIRRLLWRLREIERNVNFARWGGFI